MKVRVTIYVYNMEKSGNLKEVRVMKNKLGKSNGGTISFMPHTRKQELKTLQQLCDHTRINAAEADMAKLQLSRLCAISKTDHAEVFKQFNVDNPLDVSIADLLVNGGKL